MSKREKIKGTASVMPVGITWGVLLGLIIQGFATFIATWLVYKEHISMNVLGYLLIAGQLAGAYLGSRYAIKRVQRRKVLVGLLTGGVLFLLLLGINEALFGGHYSGILTTGIIFSIGTVLAMFFAKREGSKGYKNRRRKRTLCKIANR